MSAFRHLDYDYSGLSVTDGYSIWRQAEGRRASAGGYVCRGKVTPGPHWTSRWIGTQGMGNQGTHVIVPVSREARRLVRMHITQCWAHRYGISYRQADLLYGHRGPYKYELIAEICAAIKDTACHDAFSRFPGVGPGLHHDWLDRWGDVVASHCVHSWPRNEALIEAVNHVTHAGVTTK